MPIREIVDEYEFRIRCSSPEVLRDIVDSLTGHQRSREISYQPCDRIHVEDVTGSTDRVQFNSEGGFEYVP
jgi:hypothetical protein